MRHRRCPIDATTPEVSRRFAHAAVVAALRPRGWDAADDVVIVASELATEAVLAGARTLHIGVEVHYDHVALTVRDDRRPGWRSRLGGNDTRQLLLDALTAARTATEDEDGTVNVARVRCDPSATEGIPCRLRPGG